MLQNQMVIGCLGLSLAIAGCASTPDSSRKADRQDKISPHGLTSSNIQDVKFSSQLIRHPAAMWEAALPEAFASHGLVNVRQFDGTQPNEKIVIGDTLIGESVIIRYQKVTEDYTLIFYGTTYQRISRLAGEVYSTANVMVIRNMD